VAHTLYTYWTQYARSKHTEYEFPTVGAILADGTPIVGADAYTQRDDGSSYFVHLKPSLYLVAGVASVDDEFMGYEPLQALLTHLGDSNCKPRLRGLLIRFFTSMKTIIDDYAKSHRINYTTIALTIPNCWAKPPLTTLQETYEAIIGEVWPDYRDENCIGVLFEVEALAHYLIRRLPEQLRPFDRVIFVDYGGHTAVRLAFRPLSSLPQIAVVLLGWSRVLELLTIMIVTAEL
jgi:hypothetical protein